MLGWGLMGLGALLALVLLAPVRLRAQARSDPAQLCLELGLFWGLARMALIDTARPRRARRRFWRRDPVDDERAAKVPRRGGWRPSRRFRYQLPGALLEVLGKIRVERWQGTLWFGLEDPAMTGELYGRLAAPVAALGGGQWLRLVPVFDRETLEGEGEVALSLVPARLLPVAARLVRALR